MRSDIIEHLLLELCLPCNITGTYSLNVVYQLDIASVHTSPMPSCVGVVPSWKIVLVAHDSHGSVGKHFSCIGIDICVLTAAFIAVGVTVQQSWVIKTIQ